MRRDLVQTSASRSASGPASRIALTALCVAAGSCAAGGCAAGSTSGDGDFASPPVVTLSHPGAHPGALLPELGHAARARTATANDDSSQEPRVMAIGVGVDFPGPSSSLGAHALRANTQGGGAAVFLSRSGEALGTRWVGALELSLRVDSLPSTMLGGPELAVTDAGGATTRIGFSVRPDGIALHQRFESCLGGPCTSRSDLVSDVKAGEWRRLVVAIETYGTTAPPFGRIEVIVDDGELLVFPLTVTPFDGRAEARAGITLADSAPATARVDDVTFYARSL
jgi:hypothetical protein